MYCTSEISSWILQDRQVNWFDLIIIIDAALLTIMSWFTVWPLFCHFLCIFLEDAKSNTEYKVLNPLRDQIAA